MHSLQRDNLADGLVPDPRTGKDDRPRVPDADPNGVSPGRDGVFHPVFALDFFHDVGISFENKNINLSDYAMTWVSLTLENIALMLLI